MKINIKKKEQKNRSEKIYTNSVLLLIIYINYRRYYKTCISLKIRAFAKPIIPQTTSTFLVLRGMFCLFPDFDYASRRSSLSTCGYSQNFDRSLSKVIIRESLVINYHQGMRYFSRGRAEAREPRVSIIRRNSGEKFRLDGDWPSSGKWPSSLSVFIVRFCCPIFRHRISPRLAVRNFARSSASSTTRESRYSSSLVSIRSCFMRPCTRRIPKQGSLHRLV